MATVTGITAARAKEIADASIVSAKLVGNNLVFETGGGQMVDVGRIIPPAISAWPVGSIFACVSATNPNALLGGGTWVRWGQGRVPVSVQDGTNSFNTVEKTGGAETHKLTWHEMPQHAHDATVNNVSQGHQHTGTTEVSGSHTHYYEYPNDAYPGQGNGAVSAYRGNRTAGDTGAAGSHAHTFTTSYADTSHNHSIVVYNAGGGNAFNKMPPFITVYMWKRTA